MSALQNAVLEISKRRQRRRLRFLDEPPGATNAVPYEYAPAINGDGGPYTVSLDSGALPDGLSLAANTISGTPTTPGVSTVWLKVVDTIGRSAFRPFTFAVA